MLIPDSVISQYLETPAVRISTLGNGLINDTYRISDGHYERVLQKINSQVFNAPEKIMDNLQTLEQHLEQTASGEICLHLPRLIKTRSGQSCFRDDQGNIWRALEYIANSESRESINHPQEAANLGSTLACFHRLFATLPTNSLHDTLPGFHITPHYLKQYHQALSQFQQQKTSDAFRFCVEFIAAHQQQAHILENAKKQGLLTERVTHGDPKLNNFLFRKNSLDIISLIDLDTVKPGLIHYDIADCLRSCCHQADDDQFDTQMAEIILQNYLAAAGPFFSTADYDYLYPAIELLPFELGLRFFTDYLSGNHYFKITYVEQNIDRAISQFKLCESISRQRQAIEDIIAPYR